MTAALQDLRYGLVLLRRDATTSVLIVLALALGAGGNAAMFTLVKAAWLDPLPFPDAHRLVTVLDRIPDRRLQSQVNLLSPTVSEFLEIRRRSHALQDIALLNHRELHLGGDDGPARVVAAAVSASFFPLLGVHASLGRTFLSEENAPGRGGVVILSNNFWRTWMAADPAAAGKELRLNGEPYVVVGVMPRNFRFDYPNLRIGEPADVYIPFPLDDESHLGVTGGQSVIADQVRVFARIRDGSEYAEAAAELSGIARGLYPPGRRIPGTSGDRSFLVQPLREAIVGDQQSLLWLMLAGAGVLLLIACANTSQLLLARSLRRGREVAVRVALGATRRRLIRQFLIEGLVLAVCGGLLGLLISHWSVRLVVGLLPFRSPLLESAHLDGRVLAFTLGLSVICALVFATVPAIKGSRAEGATSLNARVLIGQSNRWRHVMIAVEAALSMFLLCGAGLIAQNLWSLISTPTGFRSDDVLMMQLRLPPRPEQAKLAVQEYLDRIKTLPGVDAAAVATAIPLRPGNGGFNRMAGEPPEVMATRRPTWTYFASPDYFRLLGIPLLAGRTFSDDDREGRPRVAVVNQEFVRSHGIEANPLGKQIDEGPHEPITIVGVVGDVRVRGVRTMAEPQLYMSYLQFFLPNIYVLVRSSLEPAQLAGTVKGAIQSSYSDQAVFNITTMDQVFSNSISAPRFNAFLVGTFAVLALLMAANGMYSVTSCLVSQRTSEIALRIALGAGRPAIAKAVLGWTSAWVLAGLVAGLGMGLAFAGTVGSLSNSAVAASPLMYGAVLLFFLLVTTFAAAVPLRRAIRLDPADSLRL